MTSRSVLDLCRSVRIKAHRHIELCHDDGIELLITCTYRSADEQDRLFNQGLSKLAGGQSLHNKVDQNGRPASEAYDVVPMVSGKCVWDSEDLWKRIKTAGNKAGMDNPISWDRCHFQEMPIIKDGEQ